MKSGTLVGRSFRACIPNLAPAATRLGSVVAGLAFAFMILAFEGPAWSQTDNTGPPGNEPYADLQSKPYEYHGLGRELAEPENIETIRIGLFVPSRGARSSDGDNLRRGAELAIIEANSEGGLDGRPFELIIRTDDFTWGSAREVVKLVYEDKVWAVAGAVGGESTHVAQQIITKAQLPLIGTASTDASLTQINIPWTFRLMPDDDAISRHLATYLVEDKGYNSIVSIASTGYDFRLQSQAFDKHMARLGVPLTRSLHFSPGDSDFSDQLAEIEESAPDAVVIWSGPTEGANLIPALAGYEVFAGPGLDRAEFLLRAGEDVEGLTIVSLCDLGRNDPDLAAFKREYSAAFGRQPDVIAAFSYDGIRLLVRAVRQAGLNRAKIRDALAGIGSFRGVTGEILFDGSGASTLEPILLTVKDGNPHRVAVSATNK